MNWRKIEEKHAYKYINMAIQQVGIPYLKKIKFTTLLLSSGTDKDGKQIYFEQKIKKQIHEWSNNKKIQDLNYILNYPLLHIFYIQEEQK